jgi:hypothetical protein
MAFIPAWRVGNCITGCSQPNFVPPCAIPAPILLLRIGLVVQLRLTHQLRERRKRCERLAVRRVMMAGGTVEHWRCAGSACAACLAQKHHVSRLSETCKGEQCYNVRIPSFMRLGRSKLAGGENRYLRLWLALSASSAR